MSSCTACSSCLMYTSLEEEEAEDEARDEEREEARDSEGAGVGVRAVSKA